MKTTLSVPAVLLAAAALTACGGGKGPHPGGPGGPGGPSAARMDGSGACLLGPFVRRTDGSLTRDDMTAGVDAAFRAADTDGDGVLGSSETARLNDAKTGTCDVSPFISWNATGTITRDDFGARYITAFDQADVNADNVVTAEELAHSFRKPPRPKREMPSAGDAPQ